MYWLTTISRSFARNIDYANTSRAPLDTDGARPRPHATETRVIQLEDALSKPALTHADVVSRALFTCLPHTLRPYQRAFKNLVKHSDAIDDRKMLASPCLEAFARSLANWPPVGNPFR
jgi:hypothetical protein